MDTTQQTLGGNGTLDAKLEAVLFASGGDQKRSTLARQLDCSQEALMGAVHDLEARLKGSGLTLVTTDTTVALTTAPAVSDTVSDLQKHALESEVGAAGLEVLAILVYRGPSSRASIDYVRGVNSAATLRILTTRGLIERSNSGGETRYQLTPKALAHMGLQKTEEAPEFNEINTELKTFEARPAVGGARAEEEAKEAGNEA